MDLSGAEVAARWYAEVVRPLLVEHLPGLPHAAGRLGAGSDVLGLDDPVSRDHDWGLRLTLLVDEPAVDEVRTVLEQRLPGSALDLPVRFAMSHDPVVRHRVDVLTVEELVVRHLGSPVFLPGGSPSAADWLALTGQAVLEVTAGPVFHDDGRLRTVRERLAWYPDDVWRLVVAADWARFGEELPFVGRTGSRGDDLGSRVVAARLVDALLHLGFLLERRWPPYPKWRGTVFAGLPRAGVAAGTLAAALAASGWHQREAALCEAAELLGGVQRATGLSTPEAVTEPFHDRPFRGVREDVVRLLLDGLGEVGPVVGSVEQWVSAVPLLTSPLRRAVIAASVRG